MTTLALRSRIAFASVLSTLAFTACKDDAPPPPSTITPVGLTVFSGAVGELLSTPLSVKVTDARGVAVGGTAVTFTVADGGGTLTASADTTDGSGLATTSWRLGERTGVAQRVTASVAGVTGSATFTATASAGPPSTIAVQGGDNQSAPAGTVVTTAPSVVLKDRFTNPVPGVSVYFSVISGGGSVVGTGATTNANGIATVTEWRLGSAVGANRLAALAVFNGVSGNPITFSATAVAGAAASVAPAVVNAPPLSGTVGALVTPVPSVRVLDANGNPVAGTSVTFAASTGSSVVNATRTTDANGLAAPDGWQLGTAAQSYTLTATVGALTPVVFTASARPGAPAQVTISAGNSQSVIAGRTLPIDPAVRVVDGFNNPVAGVEVLFEVLSGGGTALVRRPVTNASGLAAVGAWTLGEDIGTNSLRATVQANNVTGNPVLFTATSLPGVPVSMTAANGTGQSATAGTLVPVAPSVVVRDNRGNPVQGVTVAFVIGSGGGTVTGAVAVTSATGVATVGSWTLGPLAGVQTLIARVNNLPEVTFSATATAGAAASVTAFSATNLGSLVVSVGQQASPIPSVRITDAVGNPVAGVVVTFDLGNFASGTITGGTQTTNANGVATLGSWTLPTTTGIASVVASAPGLTGVTFTAAMVPSVATRLVLDVAIPVSAAAGTPISVSLRLQDQFLNNVSAAGISVAFAVAGTGGTVSSVSALTNGSGIAQVTWTIGTVGAQTLTITSGGLTVPAPLSVTITP